MDEIEMELPEGTDGPAGFRTRRKIKTRPNGCEGKFYSAATVKLCPAELPPISGRLNGFCTRARDDTFLQVEATYNVDIRMHIAGGFFEKSTNRSEDYLSVY